MSKGGIFKDGGKWGQSIFTHPMMKETRSKIDLNEISQAGTQTQLLHFCWV